MMNQKNILLGIGAALIGWAFLPEKEKKALENSISDEKEIEEKGEKIPDSE